MAEPIFGFDEVMRGLLAAARKPVVEIRGDDIVEVIDRAEANLIAHDPGVFQFGDFVVWVGPTEIQTSDYRKAESLRAISLTVLNMVESFTATSQFRKFRRGGNEPAVIDFPERYAKAYIECVGRWRLPVLTSIATAPVLCPNGRIIDKPGYDPETGVYYDPLGCAFEPVPERPTRDDALTALDLLKGLYKTIKSDRHDARSAQGGPRAIGAPHPPLSGPPASAVASSLKLRRRSCRPPRCRTAGPQTSRCARLLETIDRSVIARSAAELCGDRLAGQSRGLDGRRRQLFQL